MHSSGLSEASAFFAKSKKDSFNLIDIYHYLMIHYGYIPFEDFKKMDAGLVDSLLKKLYEMNEKQNRATKGRGR